MTSLIRPAGPEITQQTLFTNRKEDSKGDDAVADAIIMILAPLLHSYHQTNKEVFLLTSTMVEIDWDWTQWGVQSK
jgi:hypothetical protein